MVPVFTFFATVYFNIHNVSPMKVETCEVSSEVYSPLSMMWASTTRQFKVSTVKHFTGYPHEQ